MEIVIIGIALIGFIAGVTVGYVWNNRDYRAQYRRGYNDALTKNNPTEKIKNTKYNTRY